MGRPGVNLLAIAARVASPACQKGTSGPDRTRDEFMRELALRMSETDQLVSSLVRKIETLHKMEGRMPPCQWRQMMEMLVASLRATKRANHECELLLRRCALEPHNADLLKLPVP